MYLESKKTDFLVQEQVTEVRIVGCYYQLRGEAEEYLRDIETRNAPIILRRDKDNPRNPNAVAAYDGRHLVGYVCEEKLDEVLALLDDAKRQTGIETIVGHLAWVHAPKVSEFCIKVKSVDDHGNRIKAVEAPGYDWDKINFPGMEELRLAYTPQEETYGDSLSWISSLLNGNIREVEREELENALAIITKGCVYSPTIETSRALNYLADSFTSSEDQRLQIWADRLRRARISICSANNKKRRAYDWFCDLCKSEQADDLFLQFELLLSRDALSFPLGKQDYQRGLEWIKKRLTNLPIGLMKYMTDEEELFCQLFYKKVPEAKFRQILSMLVIRRKLTDRLYSISSSQSPSSERPTDQQVIIDDAVKASLEKDFKTALPECNLTFEEFLGVVIWFERELCSNGRFRVCYWIVWEHLAWCKINRQQERLTVFMNSLAKAINPEAPKSDRANLCHLRSEIKSLSGIEQIFGNSDVTNSYGSCLLDSVLKYEGKHYQKAIYQLHAKFKQKTLNTLNRKL